MTASILVIDDDAAISRLIARTLEPAGYQVTLAANGKEGLKSYRAKPADLVITDLVMPDSEGLETIRALRRLNPNVKIIAISGQSPVFLELARKLGATSALQKPFETDELLDVVAQVLGLTS